MLLNHPSHEMDVNIKDNRGNTALILDAKYNYDKIVKMLLNKPPLNKKCY